jgi:hypothetical protein
MGIGWKPAHPGWLWRDNRIGAAPSVYTTVANGVNVNTISFDANSHPNAQSRSASGVTRGLDAQVERYAPGARWQLLGDWDTGYWDHSAIRIGRLSPRRASG